LRLFDETAIKKMSEYKKEHEIAENCIMRVMKSRRMR
jgi:hypothetical protein